MALVRISRYKYRKSFYNVEFVLNTLVSVCILTFSFGVLFSSYTQQIYSQTISWFVGDYWCDQETQGIGVHCFGDFAAPSRIMNSVNPWEGDLNIAYTPVNFLYFKLLNLDFITDINTHLPTIINLVFMILALAIPGLHMILRAESEKSRRIGKLALLLSLCSSPSLMIVDRGASMFLLFPLTYFFYLAIQSSDQKKAFIILVGMSLWKPQMLLFVILIYFSFGLWASLKIFATSLIGILFSFILYPAGFLTNILTWASNIIEYQNYNTMPSLGNYSLVNFYAFAQSGVKWLFLDKSFLEAFKPNLRSDTVSIIAQLILLIFIILILINGKSLTKLEAFFTLSVILIVTPGVTFGYYLTLLLIPIFFIAKEDKSFTSSTLLTRSWKFIYFFLFFALPAWPLSWGYLGFFNNYAWALYGVQWAFVHCILSVLAIWLVGILTAKFFFRRNVQDQESMTNLRSKSIK